VALVLFAVGSSAIVSLKTRPEFVLVWLLSFYVCIGLVETNITFPRRRREQQNSERSSIPPS
jgi:CDP-diacylglycerol--serine O-phosphatidyltransferase